MRTREKVFGLACAAALAGAYLVAPSFAADNKDLEEVKFKLPKPAFIGTPKQPPPGLVVEPPRKGPRSPLLAPKGAKNLALNKPVTSSDKEPIIGKLDQITDGDKEASDGSWVELGPGKQWVQIDLGENCEIWGLLVWHHHGDPRVYKDVVIQVADDADFITNVRPIFNNDSDNTAGEGLGKDLMYFENYEGKMIEAKGAKARYVRLFSMGSTTDDQNHYTEVEIYGVPAK